MACSGRAGTSSDNPFIPNGLSRLPQSQLAALLGPRQARLRI